MKQQMQQVAKALVALLTALGTWGVTAAPDGYTQEELWGLCGVAVAAISVWAIPNRAPLSQESKDYLKP